MRKLFTIMLLGSAIILTNCTTKQTQAYDAHLLNSNLKFNEGSVAFGSDILFSNFGTEELNPLNNENKGYIVKLSGDKTEIFIPADGSLSAPKGMAIKENYLYIADVQKVVIYNLNDKGASPKTITMPEGNLFVNDIVIKGNLAYISVTNSGKIFTLDISSPSEIDSTKLIEYINIEGANGLCINENIMYVASYPADGNTNENNVIYVVEDLDNPTAVKLIERQGQYDGLSLVEDKLYFSNWIDGEIGYIDLKDKSINTININNFTLSGPADMVYHNGKLYIPNLPSSEIVVLDL